MFISEKPWHFRCSRKHNALQQFWHHAEETNDIFLLAAKMIAMTLVKARKEAQRLSGNCMTRVLLMVSKVFCRPCTLQNLPLQCFYTLA